MCEGEGGTCGRRIRGHVGEVMHVGEDIRYVCESEGTWAGRRGQACVNQDMRARARECAQGQE